MIVSVASGKGGTGKTTVATNLAVSINNGVQLLDCDVEEPNAHLFFSPEWKTREIVSAFVPRIDDEKCTYCGECAELCQFKALVILKDTSLVFQDLCHSCKGCLEVCPEKAVQPDERELGLLEVGEAHGLELVQGKLRIGEAMSPPLIRMVRARAKDGNTVIIDAPPGTSCPVINAVKNTDFVLMVTEPTPFGLHDLKLAVEAVKLLGIPGGLVINRSDVGNDDVRRYAEEENLPVLLEIPFDRKIAEAYSTGRLLVDVFPRWRDEFTSLWEKIQLTVEQTTKGNS